VAFFGNPGLNFDLAWFLIEKGLGVQSWEESDTHSSPRRPRLTRGNRAESRVSRVSRTSPRARRERRGSA